MREVLSMSGRILWMKLVLSPYHITNSSSLAMLMVDVVTSAPSKQAARLKRLPLKSPGDGTELNQESLIYI